MERTTKKWIGLALGNLVVLALLGFLLRYKIAYSLPSLDQKHLLHAHSHFAFTGWVSLALMVLQVYVLSRVTGNNAFTGYRTLLWIQWVCAWGMLVSFTIEGYGAVSIGFSTLSILVSYYYSFVLWKGMKRMASFQASTLCFKAAIIASAVSTAGAFGLSLLMATHTANQHLYLAGLYFFLHFQYNGWFILTLLGVAAFFMQRRGITMDKYRRYLWMMIGALGPSYFLSTLWMDLPVLLYAVVVISAVVQLIAWSGIVTNLLNDLRRISTGSVVVRVVIWLVLAAFSIKLMLQAGSTIPELSTLAFGFRPIVIGYLHLVLLGVVTLGILVAFLAIVGSGVNALMRIGVFVFCSGVILNEVMLMLQGVMAMGHIVLPHTNEGLLIIAGILLTGAGLMAGGWITLKPTNGQARL